jgi:transcriptional regulator GlxA family with amidase domain
MALAMVEADLGEDVASAAARKLVMAQRRWAVAALRAAGTGPEVRPHPASAGLRTGRHPLEIVARESGFRDRRHLREVFVRKFGVPPQATRRGARA